MRFMGSQGVSFHGTFGGSRGPQGVRGVLAAFQGVPRDLWGVSPDPLTGSHEISKDTWRYQERSRGLP